MGRAHPVQLKLYASEFELSARVKAVVLSATPACILAECPCAHVVLTWQLTDFELSCDSPVALMHRKAKIWLLAISYCRLATLWLL